MTQKVVLAITFPHFFSNPDLHSLLYQQRPNHTSLTSYYSRSFQYSQKFVNINSHFKFLLDRTYRTYRIIRMKTMSILLSCQNK